MNQQIVRRKINKKKPEAPRQPIPSGIMKLLQAMGKISTAVYRRSGRYTPHQGPRECARRVRQMQKTTSI
jgi:hypothetical protein